MTVLSFPIAIWIWIIRFTLPFIDDASIENSLNCLAACLYLMLLPNRLQNVWQG